MLTFSKGCSIILFGQRKRHLRKCRNWQTSKTKDLVINAIVWVQVPSSAVHKSKRIHPYGWILFDLFFLYFCIRLFNFFFR